MTQHTRTEEQKRVRKVRDWLRRKGYTLRNNGHVSGGAAPNGWIEAEDGTRFSLYSVTKDGMPVQGLTSGNMPEYSINLTLEEVELCATRVRAGFVPGSCRE